MGICFPSVDDIRSYADIIQAYKATGASAKGASTASVSGLSSGLRQSTTSAHTTPDYVTASVLLTGSAWTSVPVDNAVTLNGSPLAIAREESATGYFAQKTRPRPGQERNHRAPQRTDALLRLHRHRRPPAPRVGCSQGRSRHQGDAPHARAPRRQVGRDLRHAPRRTRAGAAHPRSEARHEICQHHRRAPQHSSP